MPVRFPTVVVREELHGACRRGNQAAPREFSRATSGGLLLVVALSNNLHARCRAPSTRRWAALEREQADTLACTRYTSRTWHAYSSADTCGRVRAEQVVVISESSLPEAPKSSRAMSSTNEDISRIRSRTRGSAPCPEGSGRRPEILAAIDRRFVTGGAGSLLAVLWFDLMFDVQALRRRRVPKTSPSSG